MTARRKSKWSFYDFDNPAANLLSQNNLVGMTAFLKNIGSNCILQNRRVEINPKTQWRLAAERSEAATSSLRFPIVWSLYQKVRTYFQQNPD